MFISSNWLSRHVDLDGVDLDELGDRFTLSVAELEGVVRVGHDLGDGSVVVGHVLEVQSLEGKKVRLTKVDTGAHGVRAIICGAPNVAAGQRVPVALPGARFGDFEIKVAKVAGVESHGMICSEKELGISDEHAGIMVIDEEVAPGTPIVEQWDIADTLFEIDNKSLTHRPDLWGHRGIAREIAALLDRPLKPLPLDVAFTEDRPLTVRVDDPVGCPRYSATCIDGVSVAPSPMWLRLLLARVGTRPISNVVDATNFVMLDLGNPLHAFDRREVNGDTIIVRRADADETFVTLDEQKHQLADGDLLIADASRGVALAGVMGGLNSEIRDDTTDVVLEAANFDAALIRMTAQRLGLRTESSARFEKSLDPRLVEDASRSFCRLLIELCPGARVTSAFQDVAAPYPEPTVIRLDTAKVDRRCGVALGADGIRRILDNLDFGVEDLGDGMFDVTVPSYRATKDIGIPEDLIEEVGRIYGYDNVVPRPPLVELNQPHDNARRRFEQQVRSYLSLAAGLDEVQSYSFDFDPLLERLGIDPGQRVTLRNPISAEMPAMRRSVVPHLLAVAERNARNYDTVGVYELGRVFHPREGDVAEQPTVLGALVARVLPDGDPDAGLFFTLKGALVGLARAIHRAPLRVVQGGVDAVWAHPVRQAHLLLGDREIGRVAEVHPLVIKKLGVRHHAAVLELDLDAWRAEAPAPPAYTPLPRFPAVYRDFAVLVDQGTPAAAVGEAIAAAAPALIRAVDFQSAYSGKGVEDGHKSLAWSVTMRLPDRTLTEPEVRDVEAQVWASLAQRVAGRPRA